MPSHCSHSITASVRTNSLALTLFLALGWMATCGSGAIAADDTEREWRATVDLGVDVSGVGTSSADVARFLASLGARTDRIIMNACEHYVASPDIIIGPDTLAFCSIAIKERNQVPSGFSDYPQ